ncbi:MAG: hypothetical protein HJJLKODD_02766 [Phycisphaerae bacterium]|nr:hypothetical protein [Phycisphaerae bacterium]
MSKKMKLGTKIAAGFTTMIILAVVLGGMAVWSMKKVLTDSEQLAQEYVPEVAVSNEIERYALLTMYNMRGYALAEDTSFLSEAQKHYQEVEKNLGAARQLAEKSRHLVKLREAVEKAATETGHYGKLMEQTETTLGLIHQDREQLNQSAGDFMKDCLGFLNSQFEQMTVEIQAGTGAEKLEERLEKIRLTREVIGLVNECRISAWKAQAQRDP